MVLQLKATKWWFLEHSPDRSWHVLIRDTKCMAKAPLLMFWPGMNMDITEMLSKCRACKQYAYCQQKEPLIMRPTPNQPWHCTGIDLLQYGSKNYVVVTDVMSNYLEAKQLRGARMRTVVTTLVSIFARHGVPMDVCSDNWPQFVSKEFADFTLLFDFRDAASSPHFPRSNGLAEKGA